MLPDRVSNPGPLTYESGALPIALRGPSNLVILRNFCIVGYGVCVINSSHSYQWMFLKLCSGYFSNLADILATYCKFSCGFLMELELLLTELQPFKLSHLKEFV